MKTITVPDLHGKDVWKDINPEEYDKIIFLGDYMDAPYKSINDVSFGDSLNDRVMVDAETGKTHAEILYNISEIIEFKKKYPDKVELLVGNHDMPYILYLRDKSLYNKVMCSGHRYTMAPQASVLFNDNFHHFKVMYQLGNVVWSHAGLTQGAYDSYFKSRMTNFEIFVEEMNKLFILNDLDLHITSHFRGGYHKYGSITWADRREWDTETYKLPFMQIVGHTPCQYITYLYKDNLWLNGKLDTLTPIVIFTDVLHRITKFFEYEVEV